MKESELKKDMVVFIHGLEHTKRTFGEDDDMRHMINKYHTVTSINKENPSEISVIIGDFCWHPQDLSLHKPKIKKPQLYHFDVKELVT